MSIRDLTRIGLSLTLAVLACGQTAAADSASPLAGPAGGAVVGRALRRPTPPRPATARSTVASPSPAPANPEAVLEILRLEGFKATQRTSRLWPGLGRIEAWVLEEGEGIARRRARVIVLVDGREVAQEEFTFASIQGVVDLDCDGLPELLLNVGDGLGCASCSSMAALTVRRDGVRTLVPPERFQALEDVDGDGRLEGLAVDPRWEFYGGLCHACWPRVFRVHRLEQGQWIEASLTFKDYYRKKARQLEEQLARQARETPAEWDDVQLGLMLSVLLHRRMAGDGEAAFKEFRIRLAHWKNGMSYLEAEAKARLDRILVSLKRDLGQE